MYKFVRKVNIKIDNEITVKDIQAYMEGTVTKFGSGAKVDCPKEFLGKKAFLIIKKDEDYLLMYQCLKVHKA
jgi:Putative transposon-encoded protein